MATSVMVNLATARDRARARADRDLREWAAFGGVDIELTVPLNPPTERAALADLSAATAWVEQWRGIDAVEWGVRHWPSVGAQRIPERLVLHGAEAITSFAGSAMLRDWQRLSKRAERVRQVCAEIEPPSSVKNADNVRTAIRAHGRSLLGLSDDDFDRLLHVVSWLVVNPASGWRIRQLPIRGIDTKWLAKHRAIVEALHSAITGRLSLGLLAAPSLVRVRFLDPGLRPGGITDLSASPTELDAISAAPATVFIFENLESVLAMPDRPGSIVIHGGGFGVAERVRNIRWVHQAHVIYWGDLDSNGFAILNELRTVVPQAQSVLMDEATLLGHRDLWVPEPTPAKGAYSSLTSSEQLTLARLRSEGNVRLEQERIEWSYALAELPMTSIDTAI